MLTDGEVEDLFRDLESDRVERKETFENRKEEIRQAMCAFANDLPDYRKPGVVFVGQRNDGGDGGLDVTDQMLLSLGGMRSDGKLLPFPTISVTRREIDGVIVAAVIVSPSKQPPVRLDGRTYIRVGPRRAIATVEEERRLTEKQQWQNVAFDRRTSTDVSMDDIDLASFELEYVTSATSPEVRAENGRSSIEKMRALRLANPEGRPTFGALLLYGIDPRATLTGAYIQFLRVDGIDLDSGIVSHKEISGTVPSQLRQLEELMGLNLATGAVIAKLRAVVRPARDPPRDAHDRGAAATLCPHHG